MVAPSARSEVRRRTREVRETKGKSGTRTRVRLSFCPVDLSYEHFEIERFTPLLFVFLLCFCVIFWAYWFPIHSTSQHFAYFIEAWKLPLIYACTYIRAPKRNFSRRAVPEKEPRSGNKAFFSGPPWNVLPKMTYKKLFCKHFEPFQSNVVWARTFICLFELVTQALDILKKLVRYNDKVHGDYAKFIQQALHAVKWTRLLCMSVLSFLCLGFTWKWTSPSLPA